MKNTELSGVGLFSPLQSIKTKETPATNAPKLRKPPRWFRSLFREKLPGPREASRRGQPPRPVPGYPPGSQTPGPGSPGRKNAPSRGRREVRMRRVHHPRRAGCGPAPAVMEGLEIGHRELFL